MKHGQLPLRGIERASRVRFKQGELAPGDYAFGFELMASAAQFEIGERLLRGQQAVLHPRDEIKLAKPGASHGCRHANDPRQQTLQRAVVGLVGRGIGEGRVLRRFRAHGVERIETADIIRAIREEMRRASGLAM